MSRKGGAGCAGFSHWHETGRTYFVPWDQEPALAAMDVLAVVSADPAESPALTVTIAPGELPEVEREQIITSSLRDAALMKRWRKERRKLEKQGTLEPLPVIMIRGIRGIRGHSFLFVG